jgi:hypothetical protein
VFISVLGLLEIILSETYRESTRHHAVPMDSLESYRVMRVVVLVSVLTYEGCLALAIQIVLVVYRRLIN